MINAIIVVAVGPEGIIPQSDAGMMMVDAGILSGAVAANIYRIAA
jgi:hypothetical protein